MDCVDLKNHVAQALKDSNEKPRQRGACARTLEICPAFIEGVVEINHQEGINHGCFRRLHALGCCISHYLRAVLLACAGVHDTVHDSSGLLIKMREGATVAPPLSFCKIVASIVKTMISQHVEIQ